MNLFRWRATAALVATLATASVSAQELSPEVTDRAVRAAVKVVALAPNGNGSLGSGSIIDPRGYVLTNFHVVGVVSARQGVVGTLVNPRNQVVIYAVDSARQVARPRYTGVVVRGDPRLDLALVRILGDADGRPLPEGTQFPSVPMATTSHLRPGARVYAFGYPLDMRTINVTAGSVTGFQMNARDELSWLRTDARFNHGNSGGMLVDSEGRLVAVPTSVVHSDGNERLLEPIELARPVERIPREWLEDLRRGNITDAQIAAPPQLRPGVPVQEAAVGDGVTLDGSAEIRAFRAPTERPATIRVTPPLPIGLMAPGGRVVREGRGSVQVLPTDPVELSVVVVAPQAQERPVSFALNTESAAPPMGTMATGPTGPTGPGMRAGIIDTGAPQPTMPGAPTMPGTPQPPAYLPTQAGNPTPGEGMPMPPEPGGDPGAPPEPNRGAPPAAPVANSVMIRTVVIDATTGQPLPNVLVVIGRPGSDVRRNLSMYLSGQMDRGLLNASLIGAAQSDVNGRVEIPGVPRGQVYPVLAAGRGYRVASANLTVAPSDPPIDDVSPLRLLPQQ